MSVAIYIAAASVMGLGGGNGLEESNSSSAAPAAPQVRQSLDDAWWTGPIFAATPATLPQGRFLIEPYLYDEITYARYDSEGTTHSVAHEHAYRSFSFLMYGLTDTFMIGLLPRFGRNKVSGGASSDLGVGDTTIRMQYQLTKYSTERPLPTLSLVLDETFPTGKYDDLGARPADGLGAGAYKTTVSLYSQYYFWSWGRILRSRLNLSYEFANQAVDLNDVSVYGTQSGFRGQARPGDSFAANLAFEYSLTKNWVPALDLVYRHSDGTSVTGQIAGLAGAVNSRTRAGMSFSLAPALEYNWSENIGFIAGVAFTVAGRNTGATAMPVMAVNTIF